MNNKDRYLQVISSEMTSEMDFEAMLEDEELKDAIFSTIHDLDEPRVVSRIPSDKKKFLAQIIFSGYTEVTYSYESLRNIEVYVGRFPYGNTEVSKLDHLKYHIENYLNEVYILKERIKTYNSKVVRAYRNSSNSDMVKLNLNKAQKSATNALSGITSVRGLHVHQNRFTDEDIDRLATLELLGTSLDEKGQLIQKMFDESYKNVRKKWRTTIHNNNNIIEEILEYYCGVLLKAITSDDKLIYPSNTAWHNK